MVNKIAYTKLFLKELGKSSNEEAIKEYLPLWWKNTRDKKEGGLRLTKAGYDILEKINLHTYTIPYPKEMPLTTQVIIYLDKFIDCPYFLTNKYINDEEPWKLKKTNTERMNTVLYCILNQIKSISILLYPIMPGSMKNTLKRLGVSENNINLNQVENFKLLKSGSIIIKGSILFEKIDSE